MARTLGSATITEREHRTYTEGDCGILALALHQLYGYTIVATNPYAMGASHMLVRDGLDFLDIEGRHNLAYIQARWNGFPHIMDENLHLTSENYFSPKIVARCTSAAEWLERMYYQMYLDMYDNELEKAIQLVKREADLFAPKRSMRGAA